MIILRSSINSFYLLILDDNIYIYSFSYLYNILKWSLEIITSANLYMCEFEFQLVTCHIHNIWISFMFYLILWLFWFLNSCLLYLLKHYKKNLPFLSMVYIDTYKWHSYIEKWIAYTFLCVAIVVNPHAKYIIILL